MSLLELSYDYAEVFGKYKGLRLSEFKAEVRKYYPFADLTFDGGGE